MTSSDWEHLTNEELRRQDYEFVLAAVEELREDLQGLGPRHPMREPLTKELELLERYLAENKKDAKK